MAVHSSTLERIQETAFASDLAHNSKDSISILAWFSTENRQRPAGGVVRIDHDQISRCGRTTVLCSKATENKRDVFYPIIYNCSRAKRDTRCEDYNPMIALWLTVLRNEALSKNRRRRMWLVPVSTLLHAKLEMLGNISTAKQDGPSESLNTT